MGRSFGARASRMQGDARERRRPFGPSSIAGGDPAPRGARIRAIGPPRGALRLGALAAVLVAVYVAGLGLEPLGANPYLRTASQLVEDGTLARGAWGMGFPLVIAPAEALGGTTAVELFLVAIAALGFVLGALLARRIVPEPYASAAAALAGLSAPAIVYAGEIAPPAMAGTLLAGATLCTVIARDAPRAAPVFGAAALLAVLPWLDPVYVVPAVPVAAALYVWCRRARHPTLGLIAVELAAASVVLYATLNERVYGGPTPWSALPSGESATGAFSLAEHLERAPRLITLWLDTGGGLLRWAPIFAFVFFSAWLLRRSRMEGLARVVPERAAAEAAAGLALAVVAAVLLVAVFLVPWLDDPMVGVPGFPAVHESGPLAAGHLVPALPVASALVAWGLRHAPRVGAVLGAATLALSAWLFVS
jgi:hypothetical protein